MKKYLGLFGKIWLYFLCAAVAIGIVIGGAYAITLVKINWLSFVLTALWVITCVSALLTFIFYISTRD